MGLRQNQSGATAVEFALIAPVLIVLLMGSIEFGLVLYTFTKAEFVTNEFTRQLATNRATTAAADSSIRPNLPAWAQTTDTLIQATSSSADPKTNRYTVRVTIPMIKATPTTFFSAIYTNKNIQVVSAVQQEPPP